MLIRIKIAIDLGRNAAAVLTSESGGSNRLI
jgi:hypothetical protein